MSPPELLRTPLHDWHVAHGGRMVDFAGWSMPVQYTSIAEEHHATRNAVGVFDISHMGRLAFVGPHAAEFIDHVVTRRVADLKQDQIRYALVCDESGGILDDVLVYGCSPGGDGHFTMVVNASNREKIVRWLGERLTRWHQQHPNGDKVVLVDETFEYAMIAVQGPNARAKAATLIGSHADEALQLKTFVGRELGKYFISRTGYTGEDGWEIMLPVAAAPKFWGDLKAAGVAQCGLGARDTLRLEAGMNLYGQDMDDAVSPYEAALAWTVALDGQADGKPRDFIGRGALEAQKAAGAPRQMIGLVMDEKGVLRHGQKVLTANGEGEILSGTFSPSIIIACARARPARRGRSQVEPTSGTRPMLTKACRK